MKSYFEEALGRQGCVIDGRIVFASSGSEDPVDDPATDKVIAYVPRLNRDEIAQVSKCARRAFEKWGKQTGRVRAGLIRKWADAVRKYRVELAKLITAEVGKPIAESEGEIDYSIGLLEWYSEEAARGYGELIPSSIPGRKLLLSHEPVGVVLGITPWNFPAAMVARKIAPAIAAGCSVVLKPAPEAPLTALALARLAQTAGLPDGVLNVVTGEEALIGEMLVSDPAISMITFTGSTAVGSWLMEHGASTIKRLSLELGGNAPFIVLPDADLELSAEQLMKAKFRASGQTCVSPNNCFVHASVFDEFTSKVQNRMSSLVLGNGQDRSTQMGPLIRLSDVDRLKRTIVELTEHGFELRLGGGCDNRLGGRFFSPTLLAGELGRTRQLETELFGPVVVMHKYAEIADVITAVNSSRYGLAGYVMGRSAASALAVSDALEVGVVGLNLGATAAPELPFGGVKSSGFGREGGRQGLTEFCSPKVVCVGL